MMNKAKKALKAGLVICVLLTMLFMPTWAVYAGAEDDPQTVNVSGEQDTTMGSDAVAADAGDINEASHSAEPAKYDAEADTGDVFEVSTFEEFDAAVRSAAARSAEAAAQEQPYRASIVLKADIDFSSVQNYYYLDVDELTIKSAAGEKFRLELNDICYGIVVREGHKCTFGNIGIADSKYYGVYGTGEQTDIVITDSEISGCGSIGVYANGIKSLLVSGTAIRNNSSNGIYSKNTASVEVTGSEISGNITAANNGGGIEMIGGSLSVRNCSITGNSAKYGGGIHASKSIVDIRGTEVSGNTASKDAGGTYFNESSVTIGAGSVISGNASEYSGGGIFCGNSSMIDIRSSEISGNSCRASGGGISIKTGSSVVLTLSKVCGNTTYAGDGGGGVFINKGSFTMKNGRINDNKALDEGGNIGGYGGGIMLNGAKTGDGLRLISGEMTGNFAQKNGGAMYIHEGAEAELRDVLICGNSAENQGGGFWACPKSDTVVVVSEGMAVFDNSANGDTKYGSAGDDLVLQIDQDLNGQEKAIISERMMSGFRNHYYHDGRIGAGFASGWNVWGIDQSAPRYAEGDSEASYSEVYRTFVSGDDSIALKNVVSDDAKAWAEASAALVIRSNHAVLRGGGIATNGSLTLGDKTAELASVSVRKQWHDDALESCTAELYQFDEAGSRAVIETAVLSKDNDWAYTFEGLPTTYSIVADDGSLVSKAYRYEVGETAIEGWEAVIVEEKSGSAADGAAAGDGDAAAGADSGDAGDGGSDAAAANAAVGEAGDDAAGAGAVSDAGTANAAVGADAGSVGDAGAGAASKWVIHNYRRPETVSVNVTKVWHDDPLESCTAELYKINEEGNRELLDKVILSADNDWTYTFRDLPTAIVEISSNGKKITREFRYEVGETAIEGWEAVIVEEKSGSAADGAAAGDGASAGDDAGAEDVESAGGWSAVGGAGNASAEDDAGNNADAANAVAGDDAGSVGDDGAGAASKWVIHNYKKPADPEDPPGDDPENPPADPPKDPESPPAEEKTTEVTPEEPAPETEVKPVYEEEVTTEIVPEEDDETEVLPDYEDDTKSSKSKNKSGKKNGKRKDGGVKTGDVNNILLPVGAIATAGLLLALLCRRRKAGR